MINQKRTSFFLISPYSDITAPGVRGLSAVLRKAGFRVRSVFVQDVTILPENRFVPDFAHKYSQKLLDQLGELADGFDLAGISLMTNYFNHAVQLTEYLHNRNHITVIWGGVHPTVRPNECLEYSDAICIGEGEETIVEVMERIEDGKTLSDIPNLWVRGEERPGLRPLISDLDSIPFGDFDFYDQFVLLPDGETIVPLTNEWFIHYASNRVVWNNDTMPYQVITSRGCPYGCTFCVNRFMRDLYQGQQVYRKRSLENVIQELQQAKDRFPIGCFLISDDLFFANSDQELEAFAAEYKKRFRLPFRCMASPNTITERKVKALEDAGLCYLEVGIQSCAPETLTLFKRKWGGLEYVRPAAEILNKYPDTIEVLYDIIVDNPWEPMEHTRQTLREIVELPRPYILQYFSLTLFPGTELFDRAVSEGLIDDIQEQVYKKHYQSVKFTYFDLMLSLIFRQYPRWILRILLSKLMVSLFHRNFMKPIYRIMYESVKWAKTMKRRILN